MTKKLAIVFLIMVLALIFPLTAVRYALSENGQSGSGSGSAGGKTKFEKDLRLNTKDQAVVKLQEELKKQGVFKAAATGFFGPLTEKAVKEFQKKNDLS